MNVYDKAYKLYQDIKHAVRSHLSVYTSTSISTSTSFSDYYKIVTSASDTVKGSFTPTEDLSSITLTDVPVTPFYIYVVCKELSSGAKPEGYKTALIFLSKHKSTVGELKYYSSSGTAYLQNISKTTSYVTFNNDGTVTLSPSSGKVFKAGFTYDYYIIGGLIS